MLQKVKSASVFQDKGSLWEKFLLNGSLYFALFVIIIVFGFLNSSYLTLNNIINVFEQSAYLLVCSIGMTFTLLIGAFDLSIGGNLAFLSVVGGALMVKTGNVPLSIAVMFACALVVGLLNGIGVVKIGLPPFIMTISMGYIVRDIVDYYTESKTISGLPSQLMKMVWYKILGVPVLIWFGLLILALGIYLLNFTGYGRTVYACGGNTDASKVMGVSTDKVRISVFVISSLCTCIGAIMVMARSGIARSGTADNLQMQCVAAAVIGRTSLTGGVGTLWGTLVGVMMMSLITSGLNAIGVDAFWQTIFTGCIIILSALLDSYKTRNNA